MVIWIITEANCCWPEWKEVKLYVIIHTMEREILASQLSPISQCQGWTQVVITLQGTYVHELFCVSIHTSGSPSHSSWWASRRTRLPFSSLASWMCVDITGLVPARWHSQQLAARWKKEYREKQFNCMFSMERLREKLWWCHWLKIHQHSSLNFKGLND